MKPHNTSEMMSQGEMTKEKAIRLLKTHLKDRFARKYAVEAMEFIGNGCIQLAEQACMDGHFIVAHDGDKTFLPVRNWLQDQIKAKFQ